MKRTSVLEEHTGCVNSVNWSDTGNYLVSGSDDTKIVVWPYPVKSSFVVIDSGHTANIFSTNFLGYEENLEIVSCAGDSEVRLHRMPQPPKVFRCHRNRVKKLVVVPGSAVFMSCSEDGTVRRFDAREPHSCDGGHCHNAVVDMSRPLRRVPFNSLALNKRDTNYFVVGGQDAFARIYDVRQSREAVRELAPAPVLQRASGMTITSVAYSPDGTEVIASYSGDAVYLFDAEISASPSAPAPLSRRGLSRTAPAKQQATAAAGEGKKKATRKRKAGGSMGSVTPRDAPPARPLATGEAAGVPESTEEDAKMDTSGPAPETETPTTTPAATATAATGGEGAAGLTRRSRSQRKLGTAPAAPPPPPPAGLRPVPSLTVETEYAPADAAEAAETKQHTPQQQQLTPQQLQQQRAGLGGTLAPGSTALAPVSTGQQGLDALLNNVGRHVVSEPGTPAPSPREIIQRREAAPLARRSEHTDLGAAAAGPAPSVETGAAPESPTIDTAHSVPLELPVPPSLEGGRSMDTDSHDGSESGHSHYESVTSGEGSEAESEGAFTPSDLDAIETMRRRSTGQQQQPQQQQRRPQAQQQQRQDAMDESDTSEEDEQVDSDEGDSDDDSDSDQQDSDMDTDSGDGESEEERARPARRAAAVAAAAAAAGVERGEEVMPSSTPFKQRFVGHSNIVTIKEADFFGPGGEFVASGSDDGNVFIWDKKTGSVLNVLEGDGEVVNCVRWHPHYPAFACSGIDNSIKLFEPEAETPADLADLEAIMERNRDRRNPMHAVPLQIRALLRALQQGQDGPIAIRVRTTNDEDENGEGEGEGRDPRVQRRVVECNIQ